MQNLSTDERLDNLAAAFEDLRARDESRMAKIDALTSRLDELLPLLDAWASARGALRFVYGLSKIIKIATPVIAAIAAIWYLLTHGSLPPK